MRRHAKAIVAISAMLLILALGAVPASAAPPVPTMGTVSSVSYASAHVTGTVDPADQETYYAFEHSTDGANWSGFSFEGPVAAGAGPTNVQADLAGLKGGTEYFVRLSALNFAEFNEVHSPGPHPSFTTLPVDPPTVLSTADAADVGYTTAKASGSVERPAGADPAFDANCRFEYVTEDQFTANGFEGANQTSCDVNPVTVTGPTVVEADLTGLNHATTYHLRLVVENAGGSDALEAANTFTTVFAPAPTVSLDSVTDPGATSAQLTSQVNPNGIATTAYFEYSADGGTTWFVFPGHYHEIDGSCPTVTSCPSIPEPVALGEGNVPVDFDRLLTGLDPEGLEPNKDYKVRLRAANVGGEAVTPAQSFKTDRAAPFVQTLFAGPMIADSTVLAGNVNPRNSAVNYQFEWGEDTSYGNVVPATPTPLSATNNVLNRVTAPISGLQPATTYHYRLVATNTETSQTVQGVDHPFTTAPTPVSQVCSNDAVRSQQNAEFLPDCRAYEKVSPREKNALDVESWGLRSASPDGNRVTFLTHAVAPGGSNGISTPLLGTRGSGGWAAQPIDALDSGFRGFSEDLTKGLLVSSRPLVPGAPDGSDGPTFARKSMLYVQDTLNRTYELATPQLSAAEWPRVGGITPDLSRILYETITPQTGDPVASEAAHVYLSESGDTRLVSLVPPPGDSTCGGGGPSCVIPTRGALIGSSTSFGTARHALSRDGKRAIFHTIELDGSNTNSARGQIYSRFDDGVNPPTTQQVSASERTVPDPAGPLPAFYVDADADHGTKVLFTSCEKLTDDSTATAMGPCMGAAPGEADGEDLYLYDTEANAGAGGLTDLTTADSSGGNVLGVVGTSDDLDHIYFVARGVLASGAIAGRPNLYLWQNGVTRLITILEGTPKEPLVGGELVDSQNWTPRDIEKAQVTRVSPDGRHLVFTSRASLTGYVNANPDCVDSRCTEVYLHDADTDQLACVSCNPSGASPEGDSRLQANGVAATSTDPLLGNLDPAGHHVIFETPDALDPSDTNQRIDVYGWFDGEIRLISTAGPYEARFVDATPSGSDVFFRTRSSLVGTDGDLLVDLYDARVDGGFLETPPPAPCAGDGCRGALSTPPTDAGPGTPTFSGPGNPKVNRCAKGKVRRNSRCVKKKSAKKHAKKQRNRASNDRRASR